MLILVCSWCNNNKKKQPHGFASSKDMFIFIAACLHPWVQSVLPHAIIFDGSLCPRSDDPSLNSFQMTPALTWKNTVPCNAQWDMRGMTSAVKCVSAPSPRPSADLWPALRPAPMDMCKYTQWLHSPRSSYTHLLCICGCQTNNMQINTEDTNLHTYKMQICKWILIVGKSVMLLRNVCLFFRKLEASSKNLCIKGV